MALPQKVIEQLSREPVRTPGWSGRLLMFTSTLFFIALAVYFGLYFGYQPYLKGQVGTLDSKIQKFIAQIPLEEQEKLINFYSQVANLRTIIDNQKLASLTFPWLEANTHIDVTFPSFGVSVQKGQVALAGRARSMEALGEQLALLEALPEVKKVDFGGTSVDKDGFWAFGLNITFEDGFLRRTGIVSQPSQPIEPTAVPPTQPLTPPPVAPTATPPVAPTTTLPLLSP